MTFSPGVDGLPTLSNLDYAINLWAVLSTQDLVIYLVGNGDDGVFELNRTETLSAVVLDMWLDNLQYYIPGKVTVVYDGCRSGSLIPSLVPPVGKERILIASTGSAQPAYFLSAGDISFSAFFWQSADSRSNAVRCRSRAPMFPANPLIVCARRTAVSESSFLMALLMSSATVE